MANILELLREEKGDFVTCNEVNEVKREYNVIIIHTSTTTTTCSAVILF